MIFYIYLDLTRNSCKKCNYMGGGGGPGEKFFKGAHFKNFFRQNNPPPPPPRRQLFREKKFSVRVRCNCFPATLPQFSLPNFCTLPQKNILRFARKYDRGPTKNFGGPQNLGARGNLPPPPLSAALLAGIEPVSLRFLCNAA